jgi:hypothetical protein
VSRYKTLRRKFTVQFKVLHVFNDGDWATEGQAWFRFQVAFAEPWFVGVTPLEEFFRPEADIDDWGETDRPYSLGFAHIGELKEVNDDERVVWVGVRGHEEDDPFWGDLAEGAEPLPFPVGAGENVPNATFQLDCSGISDFHFGVDIAWSVAYDV